MLSDDFILGLVAGEGSFHIVLESPTRQRPKFTMNMHEEKILQQIHKQLDLGTIATPNDVRTEWQIQSKSEVRDMRDWVDSNLSEGFKNTDKYRQFKLWSEAVDIIPEEREPLSKEKRKRLVELSFTIPKSNNKKKSKAEWMTTIESSEVYLCNSETNDGGSCNKRVKKKGTTCRWH